MENSKSTPSKSPFKFPDEWLCYSTVAWSWSGTLRTVAIRTTIGATARTAIWTCNWKVLWSICTCKLFVNNNFSLTTTAMAWWTAAWVSVGASTVWTTARATASRVTAWLYWFWCWQSSCDGLQSQRLESLVFFN